MSIFTNPASIYDPGMWGFIIGSLLLLVSASIYIAYDNAKNLGEIEERLEQIEALSEERLGLRTAAMGQLVAGIAHGINNLLSLIGTNARAYTGVDALATADYLPVPILAAALVCLCLGLGLIRRCHPLVAFAPRLQRVTATMRPQV